jgi:hypothetical protein
VTESAVYSGAAFNATEALPVEPRPSDSYDRNASALGQADRRRGVGLRGSAVKSPFPTVTGR